MPKEPNWRNRTLWTGDNLDIMRGMDSETVDLLCLDPPFNSKKDYAAPIGSKAAGAAFQDTWSLDDVKREWVEDIETDNTATWSAITSAGFTHGESSQAYLTYMAVRLLEMRRILRPTGSIYLHCDPTMSHYLKVMMDAVFGHGNFRNEIVWHYQRWTGATKHFQRMHDVILVYSASNKDSVFNLLKEPYSDKSKHKGRRFSTTLEDGSLDQKYTEDDSRMKAMCDVWNISYLNSQSKERTGYPTQKPLALLDRIIRASSNEGDMVLDPFCGCATTCVAAEKLGRQWAGIDIEPKARELVVKRLQDHADEDSLFKGRLPDIHHLKRPPKRTDSDAPRRSKNIKQLLFKRQEGQCAGNCGTDGLGRYLDLDLFEVDHIVASTKGGADVDDNLQLLCSTCNRRKGSKTMAHLLGLTSR